MEQAEESHLEKKKTRIYNNASNRFIITTMTKMYAAHSKYRGND